MSFENLTQNLGDVPAFKEFFLRDRNPLGGTDRLRICRRQNKTMETLHGRLKNYLRRLGIATPFSVGGIKGGSPAVNVNRHKKSRYFYLLDVKNAYGSVRADKLADIISRLDPLADRTVAFDFLKKYCFLPGGGLVVGAGASPDLFNLYAGVLLDFPLMSLCKKYDLIYSRYLDDLTFSSKDPIGQRKRKAIKNIVREAEFGAHKIRIYDLQKGPIVICGVGLEFGGRMFLSRHYLRKINGAIHLALSGRLEMASRINGMMGAFWQATERRKNHFPNKTEKKLILQYEALQKAVRADF